MSEYTNQKYRITDIPLAGKISEIGALIPYRNGNGFFRNIVLETRGVFDTQAYVQLTLFGTDATELDPDRDLERPLRCTGRVTSRKYLDKQGEIRWALSITADEVTLGERKAMSAADAAAVSGSMNAGDQDDIPF